MTAADHLPALGAFGPHRHQRAHASFVARAPRLDALPQPGFLLRQAFVEFLLLHRLAGHPFLLLPQESRIVAGPRRQLAAIDFDDPGRETLEEGAIVCDEHDGALVIGEEALEPGDGVDVQMIGGLVEQQHVRFRHECAREQHAPPPAARQCVDDGVSRQLEPREDEIHFVLAPPFLGSIARHVREPFRDDLEDRARGRQRHVLHETRHAQPGRTPNRPGVRRQVSTDNLEERRLPRAVSADNRHAFLRLDLQRSVVEERKMPEGNRNVIERD